jgi:hypothetical protein
MFLIALSLSTARAERTRVAICSSGPADPQVLEIQTRLSAELASAGFDSVVVYTELESQEAIEGAARATGTRAAIGITRGARPSAIVWVADPDTGRALSRTVELDSDSDATAILAIRAVELLKVTRLELEGQRSVSQDSSPPTPGGSDAGAATADAAPPKASSGSPEPAQAQMPPSAHEPKNKALPRGAPQVHRSRFGIYGGAALLAGSPSLPPSLAPAIGFIWRPTEAWGGALQMWGPAMKSLRGTEGTADVDEEAALAHVEFEPIHSGWMHTFARLGAGAYRLAARGDATDPYRSRSGQTWSAAGSLGLGLRSAGLRPIMILATVDALLLAPRPGVEFAGRLAGGRARPTFVAQAGIGVEW